MIRGIWVSDSDNMLLIVTARKTSKILVINIDDSIFSRWKHHGSRRVIYESCSDQDEAAGCKISGANIFGSNGSP